MTLHLDFTRADTLHKLAALPYAGWAAAIIHRIDPLWGHDSRTWKVRVETERGCSKCDGECCGVRGKVEEIEVVAEGHDDALEEAERRVKGSWAFDAKLVAPDDPIVPEWAMKSVSASADTHPQGGDVKQSPLVSGAVPNDSEADAQPSSRTSHE
jgi:hypothetical protein